MTMITPLGKDAASEEYLKIADAFFLRVLKELDRQLSAAELADCETTPGLAKAVTEVRRAMQTVFEERKRLEQSGQTAFGGAGAGALDLAEARDEIGRRLACLRDARRARELPE
ncbi:hypothetical protein GCM10016455_02580 [Aliiroseovarius zhejiangensis]|uniref:Permease n=1 Tax=Aliiroseovarius zhejiangensis TaxID=1632025 RepID=A0ABQ3ILK4_9RHOB|nr:MULTISPECIES: permease [Aliiroseovarius]MCK8483822.1 permease [Aliiroseovarius sp. S2029]GHE86457.1 hypothetical protein GCM10016455_02580 [Aliiroseovarius zhejiangensis]